MPDRPQLLVILPVLAMLAAPRAASGQAAHPGDLIEGHFLVRELDDQDVEAELEVSGATGTWTKLESNGTREAFPLRVETAEPGPLRLVVDRRGGVVLRVVFEGANHALIWEDGDNDLLAAVRVGPVPPELVGRWRVLEPDGRIEGDLVITTDTATFAHSGISRTGPAVGLSPEGPTLGLAIPRLQGSEGRTDVLRFQPLADGGWLFHAEADDDLLFLYPADAIPAWLQVPEPSGAADASMCARAAHHFVTCLTDYCAEGDTELTLCGVLPELERDALAQTCTASAAREAERLLSLSCDEIVAPLDAQAP